MKSDPALILPLYDGDQSQAERICQCSEDLHAEGRTIVFTNGCFDLLHPGHLELLRAAADLGDLLVIGLNSDDSVRQLKGKDRPVNTLHVRSAHLASLRYVDIVIPFNQPTPIDVINLLKPDVLVKGGDYQLTSDEGVGYIVGSREVREAGGRVVVIPLLEGYSTTDLIERLNH